MGPQTPGATLSVGEHFFLEAAGQFERRDEAMEQPCRVPSVERPERQDANAWGRARQHVSRLLDTRGDDAQGALSAFGLEGLEHQGPCQEQAFLVSQVEVVETKDQRLLAGGEKSGRRACGAFRGRPAMLD